jgi:hypothetical protein
MWARTDPPGPIPIAVPGSSSDHQIGPSAFEFVTVAPSNSAAKVRPRLSMSEKHAQLTTRSQPNQSLMPIDARRGGYAGFGVGITVGAAEDAVGNGANADADGDGVDAMVDALGVISGLGEADGGGEAPGSATAARIERVTGTKSVRVRTAIVVCNPSSGLDSMTSKGFDHCRLRVRIDPRRTPDLDRPGCRKRIAIPDAIEIWAP